MARMKGPDRVRAALEAAGLQCTIRTLPNSTRTAVEAAAAVGCTVADGFAIGGVPPLGYAAPVDVFMDADLFRFAEVWAAAGSPFSVFAIEPARLRDVSGAQVEDLKVESGAAGDAAG